MDGVDGVDGVKGVEGLRIGYVISWSASDANV